MMAACSAPRCALLLALLLGCTPATTSGRLYNLGVAALAAGDSAAAIAALRRAVHDRPTAPEAHSALGLALHTSGKHGEALEQHRTALLLRPDFSEARNNMGIVLQSMGRLDEAIDAFAAALANPHYCTPYIAEGNLGWALYQRGDVALARSHLQRALAQQPRFCRAYPWLTRIAWDAHDHAEMVRQSEAFFAACASVAETAVPHHRQMHLYMGLGLAGEGLPTQALEQFVRCSEGAQSGDDVARRCQREHRQLQAQLALPD